jgi:DNA-binding transcriptional ArsR family regulator
MKQTARLDATFAALADPTRRAILARLASGEASVMELARPFAMSQPAISKHLKVLEGAGLISREVDRRTCIAKVTREVTAKLAELAKSLEQSGLINRRAHFNSLPASGRAVLCPRRYLRKETHMPATTKHAAETEVTTLAPILVNERGQLPHDLAR